MPGFLNQKTESRKIFVNKDSYEHTVAVSSTGVDKSLPGGGSVTLTFNEAGTYTITCSRHPGYGDHGIRPARRICFYLCFDQWGHCLQLTGTHQTGGLV
jgi:hypothetical protein